MSDRDRVKMVLSPTDLRRLLKIPENVRVTFIESSSDPMHVCVGLEGTSGSLGRHSAMPALEDVEAPIIPWTFYVGG